jgi:hypothetical protein
MGLSVASSAGVGLRKAPAVTTRPRLEILLTTLSACRGSFRNVPSVPMEEMPIAIAKGVTILVLVWRQLISSASNSPPISFANLATRVVFPEPRGPTRSRTGPSSKETQAACNPTNLFRMDGRVKGGKGG